MKRASVIVVSALLLAACGGGGGGGNSDAAQVKRTWTKFFATSTPVSQKLTLLQDGPKFEAAITSLASNPLAQQLHVKVSSVTLEGANKAKVVYSIYLGNSSVLSNQTGYAYKQNGKWLVGYAGLCKLVGLAGKAPAACTA